jgi:hypothetical protein
MEAKPAATAEPHVRRRYLTTMRDAAISMWGEAGLADVAAALPEDARRATVTAPIITEEWLPSRYIVDWANAIWTTRAERQTRIFSEYVDRHTELGFGRVKRFLLSIATPDMVLAKVSTLWTDDNDAGELVVVSCGGGKATVELRNHMYNDAPLSRLVITELLRSILSRARTKGVRGRGALGANGALVMHFTWT